MCWLLVVFDKYVWPSITEPSCNATVSKDGPASVATPSDLLPLISQRRVVLHTWYTFDSVVFSCCSIHIGNSLIMFYPLGNLQYFLVPGSIKYIFTHNGNMYFAVEQQLPASNDTVDPFHHYLHFWAQLYSWCMSETLEMVKVTWVLSHYACWRFSPQCDVVLTSSCVSYFLFGTYQHHQLSLKD